jgi:hypothetical protein
VLLGVSGWIAATLNASTSAWRAGQRGWTDETRRSFEDATVAYLGLVDAAIAAVRPEMRPGIGWLGY